MFSVNNNYNKTKQRGNTAGNINSGGIAVNNDEWIYYEVSDTIYKMKKDGSQQTVAIKSDNGYYKDLNIVGDWIYCNYRDVFDSFSVKNSYDINTIYKMKLDGSEKTKVEEIKDGHYEFLNIVGDWIYYVKESQKNKVYEIYKIKTDGSEKTKLASSYKSRYMDLNVSGDWIYYREYYENPTKNILCKMKIDGSQQTELESSDGFNYLYLNVLGDWIFYGDNYTIYKMKIDGSKKTELKSSDVGSYERLNISGDWIYYVGTSSLNGNKSIYKMKLDGSNNTIVTKTSKNNYQDLTVAGDWIFYTYRNPLYMVKTDGSSETQISED